MVKYKTVTKREGEYLGPVNWDYDFLQHYSNYSCDKEGKRKKCERDKEMLRKLEENPDKYEFSTYPHVYHDIIKVGMYDGWPYWRPVPAVKRFDEVANTTVWEHFYEIRNIRKKDN